MAVSVSNNAAEIALCGIALGRRNWIFAGSLRGADRGAIVLTMITTCRLNDVDPKAWPADVLPRIAIFPLRVCTNCCPGNGGVCVKPTSPPISKPPDLHAWLS